MCPDEKFEGSHSAPDTPTTNAWWAKLTSGVGQPERGSQIAPLIVALSLGLVANWFLTGESAGPVLVKIFELLGAASVCIAALYARRDKGLLLMALVLIESQLTGNLGVSTRAQLHYGLLALFCVPCVPYVWRSNLWRSGNFRSYLIFSAWALLSICWSLAPSFSIARLTGSLLMFCGIIAISATVHNDKDFSQLTWRYVEACSLIVIVVVLSGIFLPASITWSEPTEFSVEAQVSRFQGILDNPNAVGALMLAAVGSVLAFWPFFGRRKKVFLFVVMVLAIGSGALADSRSPFIALAVGSALYALWRYGAKGLIIVTAAVVAIIAAMPLLGGNLSDYIHGRDVGTLSGRTDIWEFALHELRERPIRGYGYDVAGAIFQSRYFPVWYGPWDDGPQSSLHNGYLTQAIGVGIPAAIFWLYIILKPFVRLFHRKEDPWNLKRAVFFVVIPIFILNLTEASFESFLGGAGILLGMIWATAEIYQRSDEEKESADQHQKTSLTNRSLFS
jgi:O-antigen ligase